jgi:hypothetical protein
MVRHLWGKALPVGFSFALILSLAVTPAVFALGGRHDVPQEEYIKLGNNEGSYKAGDEIPDFSSTCIIGRFGNDNQWHGSGVLIAPQWVLTCAHVALLADDARKFEPVLKVRFGPSAAKYTQEYEVVAIATPLPIHGGAYDPLVNKGRVSGDKRMLADMNDLALLRLSRPVQGIKPAELFEGTPKLGSKLYLVGYGAYAPGHETNKRNWIEDGKKRGGENILDRDGHHNTGGLIAFDFDNGQRERNSLMNNRQLDNELQQMLGPGTSARDPLPLEGSAYPGDSGSPAFCQEDGRWRVLGIAGFGTDYPLTGNEHYIQYGDVLCYTRVPSHLGWIRNTMGRWRGDRQGR